MDKTHILFDLDGTLTDPGMGITNSVMHALSHFGITVTDRTELYIDDLCVDETCRGQHIGRQTYDAICRYARMRKCHCVTLNVWCCNAGAMKFYEALGLKPQKIGMETILEES